MHRDVAEFRLGKRMGGAIRCGMGGQSRGRRAWREKPKRTACWHALHWAMARALFLSVPACVPSLPFPTRVSLSAWHRDNIAYSRYASWACKPVIGWHGHGCCSVLNGCSVESVSFFQDCYAHESSCRQNGRGKRACRTVPCPCCPVLNASGECESLGWARVRVRQLKTGRR